MDRTRCLFRPVFYGALFIALMGCAHLPQKEVRIYVDAFAEVCKTTELLFEDYARAKAYQLSLKRSGSKPARLPPVFEPSAVIKEKKTVEDRRAALGAVTRYNNMLLALSQGKSVDAVRKDLGQLGMLVDIAAGGSVPALGLIKEVATEAIALAEKARSRAEFVRAFRAATGGEKPVIPAILDFFIEDTKSYSEIRKVMISGKITSVNSKFGSLARTLFNFAKMYKAPPPGKPLAAERAHLESEYNEMNRQLNPAAKYIQFKVGDEPYDNAAHQKLENLIVPMRDLAKEEQKLVDQLNAYNARLREYVLLIEKTKGYLWEIEEALQRPPDYDLHKDKILALGVILQSEASDLRGALKSLLANL